MKEVIEAGNRRCFVQLGCEGWVVKMGREGGLWR